MSPGLPLVFATGAYGAMGTALCAAGVGSPGQLDSHLFPDGERYLRLVTPVAGRDVVLLGGTPSDADTLELYDLASGAVAQGARTLTLLIPYFGHATMERVSHPGEVVTAKTRAQLFSHVGAASAGSRIVLLDLHAEGVAFYFEGAPRTVHLSARPLVLAAARRLGGADFVLACTDAGRAKWVESLANDLEVPAAFVFKRRVDGGQPDVTAISAQVQGKRVVLYDDMIRSGASLLAAARAYRQAGAASIAALATHGIFPGDALARLCDAGLFSHIVCTDSHPRARQVAAPCYEVLPVAPLLADFLRRG